MHADQLRQALAELSGNRDATFALVGMPDPVITINNAMLVPDEPDHLIKLTDGHSIVILDAERIAWVRIGLNNELTQ